MVCVFARKTSGPLASLVKSLDAKIGADGPLRGLVVFLTDDAPGTAEELKSLARSAGIKEIPLVLVDDPAGPPDYKIAREADVTVLMWESGEVKVNRAFKGTLTEDDIRAIVADIPKVLGN